MIDHELIIAIREEKAKPEDVGNYARILEEYLEDGLNIVKPEYYEAKQHLDNCYDFLVKFENSSTDKETDNNPSSRSFARKLNVSQEQLEEKLRNITYQNHTEEGLTGALIFLADEVGTTPYYLRQYYDSVKITEDREDYLETTKSELDLILKLERSALKIHNFLPPMIATPTLTFASKLKISPEACLTALITALSTCCKIATQLEIHPGQGFIVSPYQFSMIVAESGSMKSVIYDVFARDPLAALQKSITDGWKIEKAEHEKALELYDSLKPDEREEQFPNGKPQFADRPKVLYIGEKSMEGISTQFDCYPDQPLAYMKDELAGLFLDADKYNGGKGSESKSLMSMHGGSAPPRLLKNGGLVSNPGKVGLNIFGTIQPEVLQEFWSEVIDPDGYWSRFLYCYLPKTQKQIELKRTITDNPLPGILETLFRMVYALPAISYQLSDSGYEAFAVFYNFLGKTAHKEIHPALSKAYSKALGLTGRLILILHIIDEVYSGNNSTPAQTVPLKTVVKGIQLMEFYLDQRVLLNKKLGKDEGISPELRAVLDCSQRLGWITSRMVKRNSWQLREFDSNIIRNWFQELVELGYGTVEGKGNRLKFLSVFENPRQLDPKNR